MSENKINVVVAIDFSDELIEKLREVSPLLNVVRHFPEVPHAVWAETDVLYTISQMPEPEHAPRLRWIQLNSAGVDHALKRRILQAEDVLLTTVSGIHAQPIANYCLMMMLAFNYKLPRMMREQQASFWLENPHAVYAPVDMSRQTLGIVGYGTIGRELARLANAFGMRVLATKRNAKRPDESHLEYTPAGTGDPKGDIPERIYPPEAVAMMARECDYLVVITPLTPQTKHMINEQVFEAMKPSAILINVARGAVVDERALITALASGKIGGAGLDVFEEEPLPASSPLWHMDNVLISPHVSGNSVNYHEKACDVFIENLRRYLDKKTLVNLVDRAVGY